MTPTSALPLVRNIAQATVEIPAIVKEGEKSEKLSIGRVEVIAKSAILGLDTINTVYNLAESQVPFFKIVEITARCAVAGSSLYRGCTAKQTYRETLHTVAIQTLNITRLCIELTNPAFARAPSWLIVSSMDVGARVETLVALDRTR